MTRFYQYVPKDLAENLRYRIALRKRARVDEAFRRALVAACRHDVLYFFNTFCWLYEPRPRMLNGRKMPNWIPFITWPHQDPAILAIKEKLGFEDIGVEKSRAEGASWIAVLLALHDWLFNPLTAIGLVSRTEAAVDNPEDPDSLFWKLDWELPHLPGWMQPKVKRNLADHTLRNLDNGSTITGYAATADVASGGRKSWFLMDELAKFPRGPDREAMASTQYVTNSRLVVSTPKGSEGAYYDLMHEPSSMVKVVLDWKTNPVRNRGLYEIHDGKLIACEPDENPLPEQYADESRELLARLRRKGFKLDGKQRSPWYDHECDRPGATPQNIAQELDRDYGGSMYRVFTDDFFRRAEESVRQPFIRGHLDYNLQTLEPKFDRSDDGQVLLWTQLDAQNRPPRHQYTIGADISSGLGGSYGSNSTAMVIDHQEMAQVAEFATNIMQPADFADFCIALAKWLHGAFLAWEANGIGGAFTKRVKDQGYYNVYYRENIWARGRNKGKQMGWMTDVKNKEVMFQDFIRAVRTEELQIRSHELMKECGHYVREEGKIEHVQARKTLDQSSKGASHGDRVIGICVCLQGVRDRPLPSLDEATSQEPPYYSMAARLKAHEDLLREDLDDWDGRSNWDLSGRYSFAA